MTEPTQPTATSTAVPSEPVTRSSVTESRTVEQPEIAVNSSFGEKNNWSHGLFSCLDGGLGAHNYLCTISLLTHLWKTYSHSSRSQNHNLPLFHLWQNGGAPPRPNPQELPAH